MKTPLPAALAVLALTLAGCGGVREAIRDLPASASSDFHPRELLDVLPPDAVPAIERPRFETQDEAAGHLDATAPVAVMEAAGEARAYPLAILVWHEIVNDSLGGERVVVTYAPLSGSVMAFRGTVDGQALTFGGSGKLYRANLVMHDGDTGTLWSQMWGRAVLGPLEGRTLERLPVQVVSFGDLRASFPEASVLSAETGAARVYGATPYAGYDSRRRPPGSFFAAKPDRRLEPMERVVGVAIGPGARAYPLAALRRRPVAYDRMGGSEIVVLWRGGTRSMLDTQLIADARDVGSAGVFVPLVDGRRLELRPVAEGFRDEETGSTWSVLGVATSGPLAGKRLRPVGHTEALWFAWAAFTPSTTVFEGT